MNWSKIIDLARRLYATRRAPLPRVEITLTEAEAAPLIQDMLGRLFTHLAKRNPTLKGN